MPITDQVQARNVVNMFKDIANGVVGDGKGSSVVMGKDGGIKVSTSDKPGFLGSLFRSNPDKTVNRETRETFMSALKMLLGVSSDKDVEKKLGADVLKLSDFNDNKGRPLSAFRIKTIMKKVDDVLKARVQESDEDIESQFDKFFQGVKNGSLKAESESLVNGLWKSDRRRIEDIVGTKSAKSLAEDEKMLRKQAKAQNQRTITISDDKKKDDVGGLGTALLTPLSMVVGALTDRAEKRVQSIAGQGVNEGELDIQNEIDESLEDETSVEQM